MMQEGTVIGAVIAPYAGVHVYMLKQCAVTAPETHMMYKATVIGALTAPYVCMYTC